MIRIRVAVLCLVVLAAGVVGFTTTRTEDGETGPRDGPMGVGGGLPGRGSARGVTAQVVRVVDGDTIRVRGAGGGEETVRYIGIDTPESVKPGTPVQCYAKAASVRNEQLVAGRTVRLVVGAEPRDRYRRLLAYVYAGARSVNATLVLEGYARTLTIPPNDGFATRLAVLAREAQRAGRGLWSACPAR